MSKPFSLTKNERLKSKKEIDALFLSGEAFFVYPFKVCYQVIDTRLALTCPMRVGVSVPKRIFKKAHDRNRIKRLIRESYRLQKSTLLAHLKAQELNLNLMIIYTQKDLPTYELIFKKVDSVLVFLQKKIGYDETTIESKTTE